MGSLVLSLVLALHGLIHLMGFAKGFGLAELAALTQPISRAWALAWLVVGLGLLVSAALRALGLASWWMLALPAVLASQLVIVAFWQDAKAGTLANLIVLIVILVGAGRWRFEQRAAAQVRLLVAAAEADEERLLEADDLRGLPPIVRRWVERSGAVGAPRRRIVHIRQRGSMRTTAEGSWMPFVAEQWFTPDRPAFAWAVDVRAGPGVHLLGRDDFVGGRGRMRIDLFGLVPVADATGPRIDQGAALRYLAEMVWFPAAATDDNVRWRQLSETEAEATLTYPGGEVDGVFVFDDEGDPAGFRAMRYRDQALEEWAIAIGPSEPRGGDGIRVPVRSEVSWRAAEEGAERWTWLEVEILSRDDEGRIPPRIPSREASE